ncbi:hypothetical protein CHS0354_010378 [Potamilus streckersoni]|uniref:Fimbrin n=1 Tax=Potamilus streckersoni TaxID=2493646 RepID=A0AAE0TEP2_9BIVA|nr:hypothetical protein CHS0354_010378 [Potamilus streckersoni]
MSKRGTYDLSQEQLDELVNVFHQLDTDGSGKIDLTELSTALEIVGFKLPQYEVRQLIAQYDTKCPDGKIDIDEFNQMYGKLKQQYDIGSKFKKNIAPRQNLKTHGGMSDASVEGTTHSVKKEEQVAFADWINRALKDDVDCKTLLPIDPESDDLYKKLKNGIILCKLINDSVPDTIDERTINKTNLNIYREHENHQLVLSSAQAIGCNVVNIRPDELEKGKPHLVLGLLWQIIRIGLLNDINLAQHPGLVLLLEEGEEIADLMKLSPEQILIRWVNYHLRKAGCGRQIANFSSDIKDSEVYTYLLHQIAPKENGVTLAPLQNHDLEGRAGEMLDEADKIGCKSFVTPKDVVNGNPKLNLAFVANLFNTHPALDKVEDVDTEQYEETREEKTYRNWMNSMGVNPVVHYLYSDLQDGLVFFQLFDIIKKGSVDWKRVIRNFNKLRINFEKLENCNYCVEIARDKMMFSLVGIGGKDLQDGQQTATLALVWQLMRAYTLAILTELAGNGQHTIKEKDIIEWANQKLKMAGKQSSFRDFKDSSLSDGKVIIDLLDSIVPGKINFSLVKDCQSDEDKMANAKYAISMARKLGARVYALPEDIVEVRPKMLLTIFACIMVRGYKGSEHQTE